MSGRGTQQARHPLDGGRSRAVRRGLEPLLAEVREQLGADIALVVYQAAGSERDICLLAGVATDDVELPLPNEPLFLSHGFASRQPLSIQDLVLTSTVRRFRLELGAALLVPWRDGLGRGWLVAGLKPEAWDRCVLELDTARGFVPRLREAHHLTGLEGTVRLQCDLSEAIRLVAETSVEHEDVSATLEAVVFAAKKLLGTSVAYISLPEDNPEYFQFTTMLNIKTSAFRRLRVRIGEGLGGFTREQMRTVRSLNYAEDRRLRHAPVAETMREGILSAMCTPLSINSEPIGLLYVGNRHLTPFTATDVALIEELAGHATLGIRRAQMEEHRTAVMRRREQERLASRLHDSVARALTEIGFQAEEGLVLPGSADQRNRFSIIGRAAEFCLDALRAQLADLTSNHPRQDLSVGEIVESIRSAHWRESVNSTIELRQTSLSTRLPYEVADAAIRIANEAVENAQIHSNCQQLRVILDVTSETVTVVVSDDGEGMSTDELERYLCQDARHMGLRGMRMAAKEVGGRLSVSSSEQGGLTVEAVLPNAQPRHAAA